MKQIISKYIPSAKVVSFIMMALCLWQIYVFYNIGFSRGEAYAIATMVGKHTSYESILPLSQCIKSSCSADRNYKGPTKYEK